MTATETETTPLLPAVGNELLKRKGPFSPYRRILFATFLLSTTFAFVRLLRYLSSSSADN
jgi:hypothetical protein